MTPAFYDGDGTWRVRFNPAEAGKWSYHTVSRPCDPALNQEGSFDVTAPPGRGFLRTVPGESWGFCYESGERVLIWGDTTYNLFGMAHCGADTESFIRRRASQGFNVLRVRVPVSPYHPPAGYSDPAIAVPLVETELGISVSTSTRIRQQRSGRCS